MVWGLKQNSLYDKSTNANLQIQYVPASQSDAGLPYVLV